MEFPRDQLPLKELWLSWNGMMAMHAAIRLTKLSQDTRVRWRNAENLDKFRFTFLTRTEYQFMISYSCPTFRNKNLHAICMETLR